MESVFGWQSVWLTGVRLREHSLVLTRCGKFGREPTRLRCAETVSAARNCTEISAARVPSLEPILTRDRFPTGVSFSAVVGSRQDRVRWDTRFLSSSPP